MGKLGKEKKSGMAKCRRCLSCSHLSHLTALDGSEQVRAKKKREAIRLQQRRTPVWFQTEQALLIEGGRGVQNDSLVLLRLGGVRVGAPGIASSAQGSSSQSGRPVLSATFAYRWLRT